jgi:hypothetical protein
LLEVKTFKAKSKEQKTFGAFVKTSGIISILSCSPVIGTQLLTKTMPTLEKTMSAAQM